MAFFLKCLLSQELKRLPRRIILMGTLILIFAFIKWGISAAVVLTALKILVAAYLFSSSVRIGTTFLLARLMAYDHKVSIGDLAFAIYIKNYRFDQLQMVDDLGAFLESLQEENKNPV